MSLVGIPLTAAVANHAGSLPVDDAEPYYDLSCLAWRTRSVPGPSGGVARGQQRQDGPDQLSGPFP